MYACTCVYECYVACMYLLLLPRPHVYCLLVKNVFTLVTLHIKNKDPLNKESYNFLRLYGLFRRRIMFAIFKGYIRICWIFVKAYILSLIAYQMVKHNHRNPIHKSFIIFGTSVIVDKVCGALYWRKVWTLKVSLQDRDDSIWWWEGCWESLCLRRSTFLWNLLSQRPHPKGL